jgi:hypothetical protein
VFGFGGRLMMQLRGPALVLALFGCVAQAVADDADPARKKLDAAVAAFAKKQADLDKEMGALFDKKEAGSRAKGDRKAVDQLKSEREAFTEKGDLPSWTPLDHVGNRLASRATAVAAFGTAVKEYTKGSADDKAAAVEKELSAFDAKSNVVLCFEHEVRDKRGRPLALHVIKLYSNMTCDSSDPGVAPGKSTWSLKRDEMEVRWVGTGSSNVVAVDRMRIARDGTGYAGGNVNGAVTVHGKRINPPQR